MPIPVGTSTLIHQLNHLLDPTLEPGYANVVQSHYVTQLSGGKHVDFKGKPAYLSVSDAAEANIPYAKIQNKYGRTVLPKPENIQKAMETKAKEFTNRFTVDLVDASDPDAYPISAYTYMILRMDSFTHCDMAVELYRYIEWFSTTDEAGLQCSALNMIPLSQTVAKKIETDILHQMLCGDKSVSVLTRDQKYSEWLQTQTWRVPTFVAAPLLFLLIVALAAFLVFQQLKLNRAIWKKEYLIPEENIKLLSVFLNRKSVGRSIVSITSKKSDFTSRNNITESSKSLGSDFGSVKWTMVLAIYNEKQVCLRKLGLKSQDDLKTNSKRKFLFFRDKIHHLNVLQFFGITFLENQCYLVGASCIKGILRDVLQNDKFNLDINFKYSISGDVADGMEYLHSIDFIHSSLSSSVCYIDSRWTVKIADWEYMQLLESQTDKYSTIDSLSCSESLDDDNVTARKNFWKDPHWISNPYLQPSKSADIYSFAIVLVEIFTREDPYDELSTHLEPKEIMERVIVKDLRPEVPPQLPTKLQGLLCDCWQMPPSSRPNFCQVRKTLNKIKPSKKSVLDCMMEAVETYAVQLEDKVEERTRELAVAMKKTEELLHQMLPPSVAEKLAKGQVVEPESVESVTIFFSDIVGFTTLSSMSAPLEIVKLLNDLYTTFDNVIDRHQVYKVETIGDAYMVISGLPKRTDQHAAHVADMAIEFATESCRFKIHHMPHERLKLRAGIHTGPVAAGVVGQKMPRYCLFGDAVNTASRMESTSVANKIQCSETTYSVLSERNYILQLRGQISVKGKGSMRTYWLHGKAGSPITMPQEFLRTDVDNL